MDEIRIKYSTAYGCYRFASVVSILTGWSAKDLHSNRDGHYHEKCWQYPFSSIHAFCVDPDGYIFDVYGKTCLEIFTKEWTSLKPEFVGKFSDGRILPSHYDYKIVDYQIKQIYLGVSVLTLKTICDYDKLDVRTIDEIIQTVKDALSIISLHYSSDIVKKIQATGDNLLFILRNEKSMIDSTENIDNMRKQYNSVNLQLISATSILNNYVCKKNKLDCIIQNNFVKIKNYALIKNDEKKTRLITNTKLSNEETYQQIAIIDKHLTEQQIKVLEIEKVLMDINLKMTQLDVEKSATEKIYRDNFMLYDAKLSKFFFFYFTA